MFIFENLEAYKKAVTFVKKVYSYGRTIKDRSIRDQLFRAALSIPLNIAEGQGRYHPGEKKQFYRTAKGSLYECVPTVEISHSLGYFSKEEYEMLNVLMNDIAKLISGLINSQR